MPLEPCAAVARHTRRRGDSSKGEFRRAVRAGLQHLPVSPTTCVTACGGSREVGCDDTDAQEQPLVDHADLLRSCSTPAQTSAAANEQLLLAPALALAARGRSVDHHGCCGRLVAAAGAAGGRQRLKGEMRRGVKCEVVCCQHYKALLIILLFTQHLPVLRIGVLCLSLCLGAVGAVLTRWRPRTGGWCCRPQRGPGRAARS